MYTSTNSASTGEKRTYTLKKVLDGTVTKSAHPARFSPDDKYSRHRVVLKKRYGLLLTQRGECLIFHLCSGARVQREKKRGRADFVRTDDKSAAKA